MNYYYFIFFGCDKTSIEWKWKFDVYLFIVIKKNCYLRSFEYFVFLILNVTGSKCIRCLYTCSGPQGVLFVYWFVSDWNSVLHHGVFGRADIFKSKTTCMNFSFWFLCSVLFSLKYNSACLGIFHWTLATCTHCIAATDF